MQDLKKITFETKNTTPEFKWFTKSQPRQTEQCKISRASHCLMFYMNIDRYLKAIRINWHKTNNTFQISVDLKFNWTTYMLFLTLHFVSNCSTCSIFVIVFIFHVAILLYAIYITTQIIIGFQLLLSNKYFVTA